MKTLNSVRFDKNNNNGDDDHDINKKYVYL